jgi:hypothetical protein
MKIEKTERFCAVIDEKIKLQNHQSSSCIKAIGQFIRNPRKKINEDDLSNPCSVYETEGKFIAEDIQRFRDQKINHTCF